MINSERLSSRIEELSQFGKLPKGGITRLALSKEDKAARDLLKKWMEELELKVVIDQMGNMMGIWGESDTPGIAIGSHLDSVKEGGNFDGPVGVIGALEVIQSLKENGIKPKKPVILINFTNEEGVRFTPDMMGSLAFAKGIDVEEAWKIKATNDGKTIKECLKEIGYLGKEIPGTVNIENYIEIHIEQGPILESEEINIGAVSQLQGIYWTEYILHGKASHAGTTPLSMRNDAGFVAGCMIKQIRKLAKKHKGVGTVGVCELSPSQINATSETVRIIADIRHPKEKKLGKFQDDFDAYVSKITKKEGVTFEKKELVRFTPVQFSEKIVELISKKSSELGLTCTEMTSGAGHDAQMMQRVCPSAMIFIPSKDGLSHNPKEFSTEKDIENGAKVLYEVLKELIN
ncbi:MAG: M20 family metallo-hydrolase [Cyclobacteriaceae bacterium]|nr:M20 family metallo-hydrolase [Cyclobacteriaceae bacterium]